MIKKKNLIFFLLFVFIANCSFDNKTGIWGGSEEEKRRLLELEKQQNEKVSVDKVYSSENIFSKELALKKEILLSKPIKNKNWGMQGLNHQNYYSNIYLPGINQMFLKKKIGKNKSSISRVKTPPLILENNIIFSDDKGTIFNINLNGKINWKNNIYKKYYKKIYKNLSFSVYKNIIYIADNIGFIYAISLSEGKIVWIKNHGIPLRSKIKIFKNKIFLINQDNRLISLSTKDGSLIWDIRSISSFIKSQNFLSLAISEQGDVIASNSAGDLLKVNSKNGSVYWSLNALKSMMAHATDFFRSSDIVVTDKNIFFSTQFSFFSYDLNNGYTNWEKSISSVGAPIIVEKNIFIVTENGYFVILNAETGEIISSTNILNILKKKNQSTKVTGFIMGSGKIYSVTLNGFLIISSASTGKVEEFKKLGDPVTANPIISDGKLFIYTDNSRILGFN